MSNVETPNQPLRAPRGPRRETTSSTTPINVASSRSRVMLVDFRSGEPVQRHPEVMPLLMGGWVVKSAVPRLVENEGLKLLVVLKRSAGALS